MDAVEMEAVRSETVTFPRQARLAGLLLLVLLIGAGVGYWLGSRSVPGLDSADVGFARDMSDHHRQAVEMSKLLYDRTDDELMRSLAFDIMTTQQAQIGMMSGWLDSWGLTPSSTGPKMGWMGMPVTGLMPGMATREQLNELAAAQGVEADVLFLRLMIPHHQSGVEMAAAAAEQAETEAVQRLAQTLAEGQQAEIEYMQQLLQEKGSEPVPESELDMGHDH